MTRDSLALPDEFADFQYVEARGMLCPWPALRLAKAMRVNDRVLLYLDPEQPVDELVRLCIANKWPHKMVVEGDSALFAVTCKT